MVGSGGCVPYHHSRVEGDAQDQLWELEEPFRRWVQKNERRHHKAKFDTLWWQTEEHAEVEAHQTR